MYMEVQIMKHNLFTKGMLSFLALILLVAASACGGGKADTAATLPVYPGATLLKPGEDPVADTLAKNMEQDAAIRQSAGVGGKIEQTAYKLPADASWDQIKAYFDKELTGAGWKSGMGGIGGDIANQALEASNQANEYMKISMWSKGKQTLTVIRAVDMSNTNQPYLLVLLNTN